MLSGTVADNIRLGHEVDAADAVSTAQLEHDLAAAGGGLRLLIGHKGTRLSGGQLQRLALARALAPRTELLIADDVSSALDVTTELELWRGAARARRHRGRLHLEAGRAGPGRPRGGADRRRGRRPGHRGPSCEDRWGHLAG